MLPIAAKKIWNRVSKVLLGITTLTGKKLTTITFPVNLTTKNMSIVIQKTINKVKLITK
jgi:hypothetical protein